MSIHKRTDRDGFQVKWREGGRQRSRMFTLKGDAQAFERDLDRRRALGPLAATVMMSQVTLTEFVTDEWWPRYAIPNLKPSTRRRYLEVWDHDLLPRVGGYELRQITPALVEDVRDQLAAGGLSPASQRKALLLLSGILKRATVRGLIPGNPVTVIDMPKAPPQRRPQPLAPVTVEQIRSRLRSRDATIVSMLAYTGIRPGEMMHTRWEDLSERSLYVAPRKTAKERDVDLLSPVLGDLHEWRLSQGRPGRGLIFPCEQIAQSRQRKSAEWQLHDWQNWVHRVYQPAAQACGVIGDMRAYRLRGSFVSLLLWSGMDLVEVSEQSGHSVATLAKHYAGVIRELKGQPKTPAGEQIRQAREAASGQLRLVAR